ncbi:prophage antirepressor [Thiovulum sp. ES]|nr:prophage antirepressor [Thiovulum sp. ES]
MEQSIITKVFSGKEIFFDKINEEIYLNATKTAKAFGKRVDKWKENSNTIEYLEALSNYPEKGELNYIISKEGRYGGTWIHKKLIISFSRWLDAKFSVWCDEVIEEILSTGSYSLQKEKNVWSRNQFDFREKRFSIPR